MTTIIVPDWMLYVIYAYLIIDGANTVLGLYLRYLNHKIKKQINKENRK